MALEPSMDSCVRPLVTRFLQNRSKELPQMAEAYETRDYPLLERIGHNLKGAGTSFGFPEITMVGADLEDASRHRDPDRVATLLAEYRSLLAALTAPVLED